jgi:hypothetical protein
MNVPNWAEGQVLSRIYLGHLKHPWPACSHPSHPVCQGHDGYPLVSSVFGTNCLQVTNKESQLSLPTLVNFSFPEVFFIIAFISNCTRTWLSDCTSNHFDNKKSQQIWMFRNRIIKPHLYHRWRGDTKNVFHFGSVDEIYWLKTLNGAVLWGQRPCFVHQNNPSVRIGPGTQKVFTKHLFIDFR